MESRGSFPFGKLEIFGNVKLSKFTTWGVGGPARYFAEPISLEQFVEALRFARERGMEVFVMGSGSNLLVHDSGFPGLVIRTVRLNGWKIRGDRLTVDAGVKLPFLARIAAESGLSGLEELSGIPGTIGGALIQNAGAYGREFGELVEWVELLIDDKVERYTSDALKFCYRRTILPAEGYIVRVGLRLVSSDKVRVRERIRDFVRRRRSTQPLGRTAGSVFKNPKGRAAGWLLDRAGLKGVGIGGAKYSEVHANFIVNTGGAKADDIFRLMKMGRERVLEIFGVELEPEIKMIGAFEWQGSGGR